jgi:hypothetical protein
MNPFIRILILPVLVVLPLFSAVSQNSQHVRSADPGTEAMYDCNDRLILENGHKIEYDRHEQAVVDDRAQPAAGSAGSKAMIIDETNCDPAWIQAALGSCIGQRAMHSYDFNNDGKTEIICTGGEGFGSGSYWYFLEYDEPSTTYQVSWASSYYDDYWSSINTMNYFDLGSDGSIEILCGHKDGNVSIYNAEYREYITTIESGGDWINRILHADADNDGTLELVFCDDDLTYIYDDVTLELDHIIDQGGDDFEIGNVDADPDLEIIYTTGNVISFDGTSVQTEWDFTDGGYEGLLELSDFDGDGMQEIIFARYWYKIEIFDADIQSLKKEIESDLDIDALLMEDVNGDGVDELLYGDGQWGSIYCHNPLTTQLLWSISNPEHGTSELHVGDVDDDGELEVMWGAGCSSTGPDILYIHDIQSGDMEFESLHIDPPFYSVEVEDVDDDGEDEILTLSYKSNSGYDSGILTVFDAEEHSVEWQSDGNYFEHTWTGMYAMEIDDIDEDGETEIIIAAGRTYTGRIWIINGHTYEIESDHIFGTEDLDEFSALNVADIDNDDEKECIVGEDGRIHVINPSDYSIEWSAELVDNWHPRAIHSGDVNENSDMEIVVCAGYIYVYNGVTQEVWWTENNYYNNCDLVDIDNDGRLDIVACTSTGKIVAIDGETQQITELLLVEDEDIRGVRMADLTGDGELEYVFTSWGSVFFYTQSGLQMQTQDYGNYTGSYDALKVVDPNDQGTYSVFAGTNYLVIELTEQCYQCIDFTIELFSEEASCSPGNDGIVEVVAAGGVGPYTYEWDFGGTNALETGLEPGTYSVTVTDSQGCEKTSEITVTQAEISSGLVTRMVSCSGYDDGMARINIYGGLSPFSILWSTGEASQQIDNLAPGNYSVQISDANQCSDYYEFTIEQDTVIFTLITQDISCAGYDNGYAEVYLQSGLPPFQFTWSDGNTGYYNYNMGPGDYSITVTDSLGCSLTESFTLVEPDGMIVSFSTLPDDPDTEEGEGSATANVTGGMPPYYYQWWDPYYQTNQTAINLVSGEYPVEIMDASGCGQTYYVFVTYVNAIDESNISNLVRVYPNPSDDKLYLDCSMLRGEDLEIKLFSETGILKDKMQVKNVVEDVIEMDVSGLVPGLYLLHIGSSGSSGIWKVSVF